MITASLPLPLARELVRWRREQRRQQATWLDPQCRDARSPAVSSWSVGQQVEHLLQADLRMTTWLVSVVSGEASGDAGAPSRAGRMVLLTGWIPRGKGRAPEATVPRGLSQEEVAAGFHSVGQMMDQLAEASRVLSASRARRPHPLLGGFSPYQWIRFGHVHHRHHRAIIGDILAAARGPAPAGTR